MGITAGIYLKGNKEEKLVYEKGTFSNEKIKYVEKLEDKKFIITGEEKSYEIGENGKKELEITFLGNFTKNGKKFYIVKQDKKVGLLNEGLKQIVTYNYDQIENLGDTKFIKVKNGKENYLINIYNYEMSGPYDDIGVQKNIISIKKGESINI